MIILILIMSCKSKPSYNDNKGLSRTLSNIVRKSSKESKVKLVKEKEKKEVPVERKVLDWLRLKITDDKTLIKACNEIDELGVWYEITKIFRRDIKVFKYNKILLLIEKIKDERRIEYVWNRYKKDICKDERLLKRVGDHFLYQGTKCGEDWYYNYMIKCLELAKEEWIMDYKADKHGFNIYYISSECVVDTELNLLDRVLQYIKDRGMLGKLDEEYLKFRLTKALSHIGRGADREKVKKMSDYLTDRNLLSINEENRKRILRFIKYIGDSELMIKLVRYYEKNGLSRLKIMKCHLLVSPYSSYGNQDVIADYNRKVIDRIYFELEKEELIEIINETRILEVRDDILSMIFESAYRKMGKEVLIRIANILYCKLAKGDLNKKSRYMIEKIAEEDGLKSQYIEDKIRHLDKRAFLHRFPKSYTEAFKGETVEDKEIKNILKDNYKELVREREGVVREAYLIDVSFFLGVMKTIYLEDDSENKENFLKKLNYRDKEGRNILFIGPDVKEKVRGRREGSIVDIVFGNTNHFSKKMNEVLKRNIGKISSARYREIEGFTYHQYNKGKLGVGREGSNR